MHHHHYLHPFFFYHSMVMQTLHYFYFIIMVCWLLGRVLVFVVALVMLQVRPIVFHLHEMDQHFNRLKLFKVKVLFVNSSMILMLEVHR